MVAGAARLDRVLECETMMSGDAGKHRLWASLRTSIAGWPEVSDFDFAHLERRAEEQLDLLRGFHHDAARRAFGAAPRA